MLGVCCYGDCFNNFGFYCCVCLFGYSLGFFCIQCIVDKLEEKSLCFCLVSFEYQCQYLLIICFICQFCCCSVGKVWGVWCQCCLVDGIVVFKEICLVGKGYYIFIFYQMFIIQGESDFFFFLYFDGLFKFQQFLESFSQVLLFEDIEEERGVIMDLLVSEEWLVQQSYLIVIMFFVWFYFELIFCFLFLIMCWFLLDLFFFCSVVEIVFIQVIEIDEC